MTKEITINPIKNGTVLDHLPAGTSRRTVKTLKLENSNTVSMAINVSSKILGKKDLIYLSDKYLDEDELAKIGLCSPGSTHNVIKEGQIERKSKIDIPKKAKGILKCLNDKCITNHEPIKTQFLVDTSPLTLQCHYCEKSFSGNLIEDMLH